MKNPTVYVGIVSYKSAALLSACLTSLQRQTYTNIHTVIWDNAGELPVKRIAKRYGVRYIASTGNVGYGGGHNAILDTISLGTHDYYLTLNPDALLEPGYVASLVRSLGNHKAGWGTGKLYRNKATKELYSVGHAIFRDGYAFNIGYGCIDRGQYDTPRTLFGAPGAAALYSARFIHTLSKDGAFFDPLLFMYYEDVDVDWRGQRHGFFCWYEPNATAVHPGGILPRHLEGPVLVHRFITVVKNASTGDLFFYNMPRILMHILARMLVTPRIGLRMAGLFFHTVGRALQAREIGANYKMDRWFRRAASEQAKVPKFGAERVRAFFIRRIYD